MVQADLGETERACADVGQELLQRRSGRPLRRGVQAGARRIGAGRVAGGIHTLKLSRWSGRHAASTDGQAGGAARCRRRGVAGECRRGSTRGIGVEWWRLVGGVMPCKPACAGDRLTPGPVGARAGYDCGRTTGEDDDGRRLRGFCTSSCWRAIAGNVIISRVPVILHTPLMSGSNFIHGIVLIGAMVVLGHADTTLEKAIGFVAVLLGAGNAAGGYVVTERMLDMFKSSKKPVKPEGAP